MQPVRSSPASCFVLLLLLALPLQAQWHEVERAPLEETIRLDGAIEAVQRSTVSAQTSGTVQQLPFDVDDSVEAGELIVRLDDSEQCSRLNQTQSSRSEAEANLEDAQQRFQRVEQLFERNVASRSDLDQARNNLNAARARLERAESAVEEASKQFDYTRVRAPYSGIVTDRHVEVGESVSPGQPLMSGLSLEQLRVVVSVPQRYADIAREDRRAEVRLNDGRILETGQMTFYPYADSATHSFRVRLQLHEPDGQLFPGMLVRVELPVSVREALWIPESALIRRSELRAVQVLDDNGEPRLRQVRIGVRRNGQLEVLSGLSEGERIVTEPHRD